MSILTEELYKEMQKIDDEKQVNKTFHIKNRLLTERKICRELNCLSNYIYALVQLNTLS